MMDTMDTLISFIEQNRVLFLLLSLPLIGFLLYKKGTSNHNYWRHRNVPGPNPIPFFGNFHMTLIKRTDEVDIALRKQYGPIVGMMNGNKPVISISDPNLIKKILVKDFHLFSDRYGGLNDNTNHPVLTHGMFMLGAQRWKRVRTLCSPSFTGMRMRKALEVISPCVTGVMDNLQHASHQDTPVDLKKMFRAFTLDTIAKAAFGTTIDTHKNPDNDFVKNLDNFFSISWWRVIVRLLLPPVANKFNVYFNGPESYEFFMSVTSKIIEQRRGHDHVMNHDLLQFLIDAELDPSDLTEGMSEKERKLSEIEIIGQAFIFLLAGFETTSSLLTYAVYRMALDPHTQDKAFEEVNQVVGLNGTIDYDMLNKLHYIEAILDETLRLYSPLYRLDRKGSENYYDPDTGITIEKDVHIIIPIYAVHYDETLYPEPDEFKPERFLPENREKQLPYSWLPFGAGPRNCIGLRFGIMEAKLLMAKMVQQYTFHRVPQTDVPLQFPTLKPLHLAKSTIVGVKLREELN